MSHRPIELRGVEVHNLQRVNLDIPTRKLVALCGVSGSGKTSLALDTLYAEGQRRYIESFSVYSRQFLDRLEKPAAERIDHLPAAMAVQHQNDRRQSGATVGAVTEVLDHLRLLFAKVGKLTCPTCGRPVRRSSPQSAAEEIAALPSGRRLLICFPLQGHGQDARATWYGRPAAVNQPGGDSLAAAIEQLRQRGFVRVIHAGQIIELSALGENPVVPDGELLVVVDRLTSGVAAGRLVDSLETAIRAGHGACQALWEDAAPEAADATVIDGLQWRIFRFQNRLHCAPCHRDFTDPEPRFFSFTSPHGACPACAGSGETLADEPESPLALAKQTSAAKGKHRRPCPQCRGARLHPEALAWRVDGKDIAEISSLRLTAAAEFFEALSLAPAEQQIARAALGQARARLGYLLNVGLGYLTLDRKLGTLSGGEAQRVALTTALGASLVDMLYVLDEPSVGLHPRDIGQLAAAIVGLRDRGNSVLVVEHEESLLRAADWLIEFGPGAGESGGRTTFQGSLEQMLQPGASLTGEFLAGRRGVSIPEKRRPTNRGKLRLCGARGHNLRNLTVDFPLGLMCLVTGVSGAGKSSLVQETLYGAVCLRKRKTCPPPLPYDDLIGDGQIDDVILVDHSPIGRSPRSNPVTYLKAFDPIRAVFAETVEARTRNYTAGHFSFNVEDGRCTACQGDGCKIIDMQFLPDISIPCPECRGARYRREILAVTYRGKNIAEVLALTAREAFSFFRGQPKVQARLKQLLDVGLDYLQLGQPATTLSTGEAQRLKLAAYLSEASRNRTLFLLDEPTTGLHFADVLKLLDCFDALLNVGHSLIIVEHNLQLMRAADYLIDLGPEAGDQGGRVVCCGAPEEVAACVESVTGRFLAESLAAARESRGQNPA